MSDDNDSVDVAVWGSFRMPTDAESFAIRPCPSWKQFIAFWCLPDGTTRELTEDEKRELFVDVF